MKNNYPQNLKDIVRPIRSELLIAVSLSILGTISLLIAPVAITTAVTNVMSGHSDKFLMWVIIGSFGLVLRQMLHMSSLGYAHIVEAKFRHMLRKDFSDKLGKLPLGFFSEMSSGAIRKFISEDTVKIHTIVAHGFTELSSALTLPIACVVIMLIFEWRTALIILGATFLLLGIGAVWMRIKSKGTENINLEYEKAQREMSHSAIEMVDGIKEIKNFGLSGSLFKRFDDNVNKFSTISFRWLNTSSKPMAFVMSAVQPTVMLFLSLGVCLFSVINNWLRPEQAILFMLLSINLPSSLISLMQIGNHLKEGRHAVDNLISLYQKKDQAYEKNPKEFVLGNIEFKNVFFSYDDENDVLKDVNCIIEKEKLTAFVGGSGGGKTTMARLISRFWNVKKGVVTIGSVDVKHLSEKDLLSNISLVFQDISLMNASIADNIALSRPAASREDVVRAAKSAMIHDKIMELPKGYDSVYGEENVNLSGGERQRITIARAFLADAPIVLLDEATAQADAQSEEKIQKALGLLSKNKTVIMIAHRLSSIVNADQILVIDRGEIKESGTHRELMNVEGVYKAMWQAQNPMEGAE